ncbi:MAG: hypothetical protein IKI71_05005 [Lachnospiraceae bacterium]|nr:hypothetical protein [Lachnospiraceae bacterium]
MKGIKFFVLINALFVLLIANVTFAGWVQDGELYKYEENGAFITSDWLAIKGDNYYFDANSHMVTGLQKIGKYYYVFKNNGIAYKKSEKFVFENCEYDIGPKGKVLNLESDITDEEYKTYLANKAIEDANNKAFHEAQKVINESIAAERAKVEKEQEAIRESQRAATAAAQALIDESTKARKEFLLSAENDASLVAAANKGTASKPVVDSVMKELRRQLNLRKIELIGKAKELRASNPMAELNPIEEDFKDIIGAYESRVDDILSIVSYKFNVNEEKMDGYEEQFAAFFSEMQSSFVAAIDNILG